MFREMRRKKQQISEEECVQILNHASTGILAVNGDGGFPYTVPLNFLYDENKIYFHCAGSGHKIDSIVSDDKVSFCVVDKDEVIEEKFTAAFMSVVIFGRASIIDNEFDKTEILKMLNKKYSPTFIEEGIKYIKNDLKKVCVVKINIEHMTGKEGLELFKLRK